MQLTKKQKTQLENIGWTPCTVWAGWDWDFKGNPLTTLTELLELPKAEGYDFAIVGYRKSK
jgi:hypothetical protein